MLVCGSQIKKENGHIRANYNDYTKGIRETSEYLELFLRNLLLGENNELKNRYIHVVWKKQDIQRLDSVFGYDKFFGRTEVMNLLEISASPASELIKKMLGSELIYPLKGKGKGKYLFGRRQDTL